MPVLLLLTGALIVILPAIARLFRIFIAALSFSGSRLCVSRIVSAVLTLSVSVLTVSASALIPVLTVSAVLTLSAISLSLPFCRIRRSIFFQTCSNLLGFRPGRVPEGTAAGSGDDEFYVMISFV